MQLKRSQLYQCNQLYNLLEFKALEYNEESVYTSGRVKKEFLTACQPLSAELKYCR